MWSEDDDYCIYSPYYGGSDFDDSDDDIYYGYSSGEDFITVMPPRSRTKITSEGSATTDEEVPPQTFEAPSLQDLCCRFIARKFPFAFVEHRSPPIPDELQLKIIEFSFPDDEEMIRKYAEFSRTNVDFYSAKRMVENGKVKELNHIGFRLSAYVEDGRCSHYYRSDDTSRNYVTILFDRGKITSAHCSCEFKTNWCVHVVATCLARIKDKKVMTAHLPVSDSLNVLNREQLLKFSQYLLSEHQNEPVVETAQKLLDKLLSQKQRDPEEEDINQIAGAPDPTAGPGLDEEAHWFVCKNGFKSRLESLMHESPQDLGFDVFHGRDHDNYSGVSNLWDKNVIQQLLVRDEIDLKLDKDHDHYGYHSSRRQTFLKVLETISDLLQDDFMSAVTALTMCTEQLTERLSKFCSSECPKYRKTRNKKELKDGIKLCGSLAAGFTPRMSSCSTLSDELSRLWRLAVLNPCISGKQRQAVVDQLMALNEAVSAVLVTGTLRPWHGLEVAIRLASINWDSPEFQRLLRGDWAFVPFVRSWMVIELTCHSKDSLLLEMMESCDGVNERISQAKDEEVISRVFYHPHCIALGPLLGVDIHSLCSMIEALNLSHQHQAAMRLTVALSYAIVSAYQRVLFGVDVDTSMTVSARCSLGKVAPKAKVTKKQNSQSDSQMEAEVMEADSLMAVDGSSSDSHIWPEDTILSISTFAFLYDLLSKKPELADACVAEMKSNLDFEGSSVRATDCLRTSASLAFQLGVVGLYLQRFPAPLPHHEIEGYNHECWLTHQLTRYTPLEHDLFFLAHLGQQVQQSATSPNPVPASSPCRVIFHHLFTGASETLRASLTEYQRTGLEAAFSVLAHMNKYTVKENLPAWVLFQYSNCRMWAKLAEVVLRSLSDSSELLSEAMGCILKADGMLGALCYKMFPTASLPSNRSLSRDIELIDVKSRVAYSLARALSERLGRLALNITEIHRTNSRRVLSGGQQDLSEIDIPRKMMKSGDEKPLKFCAIEICAQSLWLRKCLDKDHTHREAVRWLTEFVVNSGIDFVERLVKCKGDVSSFLEFNSLLDLCGSFLKVKRKSTSRATSIVKDIFSSLLQKASRVRAAEDMKAIVNFGREKQCAKNCDLLPWICKELQTLEESESFLSFDAVMEASSGIFDLYKERLYAAEKKEQESEWTPGGMCLKRLFNEESIVGDEADFEDNVPTVDLNPYRSYDVHPFLKTAFTLGIIGVEKLKEELGIQEKKKFSNHHVNHHLKLFCRVVCYVEDKGWLKESGKEITNLKSPKKEYKRTLNAASAKPGCSHWEDHEISTSEESREGSFLHKFVSTLINCVDHPLWLFQVLQELGEQLSTDASRDSIKTKSERQNIQIDQACQSYPSVRLLLQKDLDAFSKLLLGPTLSDLVKDICGKPGRRQLDSSEMSHVLGQARLMNTQLQEVLTVAKRAFSISDSSGAAFKSLTDQLREECPILKALLKKVLDGEVQHSSPELDYFLSRDAILSSLWAHRLLPMFLEESNEYF